MSRAYCTLCPHHHHGENAAYNGKDAAGTQQQQQQPPPQQQQQQMTDKDFKQIWDSFNKLRVEGHLCDAVIVADDFRFPVHRAILAANSPYFRALFTNGMRESEEREVHLESVEPIVFGQLIDYVYTRSVDITTENVRSLLIHAERFIVHGLVERCSDFIKSTLTCANCVGVLSFARQFYLVDMQRAARKFLLANFFEVTKYSKEFSMLEAIDFREIIADDALNARCEEDLFEAIVHWIDFDHVKRAPLIAQLLNSLRLGLVSTNYFLERISSHPYVAGKCEQLMQTVWNYLYRVGQPGAKSIDPSNALVRPRIPHDVLFAIGGWSGGSPIAYIETYDVRADRWYSHPLLEDASPRAYHGVATLNNLVYIIGGFDGSRYYNNVKSFCPVAKSWYDVAPMYSQRCYVSCAVCDEAIYAMGGYDGQWRLNTAEVYNPTANQWTQIAPMLYRRSDAGADSINGRVYIVGGFNGEQCLSSMEMYCPVICQWTVINNMSGPRSGVSVVAWQGRLYALGGFDGERRLNTCESYCPVSNRWMQIAKMRSPRSNFAVGVIEDVIYVIGGFSGTVTIPNVEWYNEDGNVWSEATDMNVNRSALKACVVSGLDNVVDYTYYGHYSSGVGGDEAVASGSIGIASRRARNAFKYSSGIISTQSTLDPTSSSATDSDQMSTED